MLIKQLKALFVYLLILWLSSAALVCQSQEQLGKADAPLALVDATALAKKTGAVAVDLKRKDFMLRENGVPQEIAYFSREELPLSVMLLLDVSSASARLSMKEVQRTAKDALARLKPQDKAVLMIIGEKPHLIVELTADHAQIAKEIDDIWLNTAGLRLGVSINLSIREAARYLRQKTEPGERHAIVIITDDKSPSRAQGGGPQRDSILEALDENDVTLCGTLVTPSKDPNKEFAVGMTAASTVANPILGLPMILFGALSRSSTGGGGVSYFAERTGGVAIKANGAAVGRVFVEMMEMLRARYTLGYHPPASPADGKLREIKLTVNPRVQQEQGEVLILTRHGYYPHQPLPRLEMLKTAPHPNNENQPSITQNEVAHL